MLSFVKHSKCSSTVNEAFVLLSRSARIAARAAGSSTDKTMDVDSTGGASEMPHTKTKPIRKTCLYILLYVQLQGNINI